MLIAFLEIMMSMLTVYGLYCLIINLTYLCFCKEKTNVCIAFFKNKNTEVFSNVLLAKKAFMGRTRTIILVDYNLEDEVIQKIAERNPNSEIYRAERVEEVERIIH